MTRKGPDQTRGYKQRWVFQFKPGEDYVIVTAHDQVRNYSKPLPCSPEPEGFDVHRLTPQDVVDELRDQVVPKKL